MDILFIISKLFCHWKFPYILIAVVLFCYKLYILFIIHGKLNDIIKIQFILNLCYAFYTTYKILQSNL